MQSQPDETTLCLPISEELLGKGVIEAVRSHPPHAERDELTVSFQA